MKVSQLATMVAMLTFGCGSDHGETAVELDAGAADAPVVVSVGRTLHLTLCAVGPSQYQLEGVAVTNASLAFVGAEIPEPTPGGHCTVYTFSAEHRGEATVTVPRSGTGASAFVFDLVIE